MHVLKNTALAAQPSEQGSRNTSVNVKHPPSAITASEKKGPLRPLSAYKTIVKPTIKFTRKATKDKMKTPSTRTRSKSITYPDLDIGAPVTLYRKSRATATFSAGLHSSVLAACNTGHPNDAATAFRQALVISGVCTKKPAICLSSGKWRT